MFSMDGESASDAEDQSHEEPGEAGQKKRARKIPKLPMVRHGKKWYRARLLRDSGQRVHIGAPLPLFLSPQHDSTLDMGCLLQAMLPLAVAKTLLIYIASADSRAFAA